MAEEIAAWRQRVINEVNRVADEEFQRRVWFGEGPWVDSPNETFCGFFDDADVPAFLSRPDNGLSANQTEKLKHLADLMQKMSDDTPMSIRAEELIDDPRWQEICKQAAITAIALLQGA